MEINLQIEKAEINNKVLTLDRLLMLRKLVEAMTEKDFIWRVLLNEEGLKETNYSKLKCQI